MKTLHALPCAVALGVALVALDARETNAQLNVAAFQPNQAWVYTTFGLDPAFVASIGYGRSVGRSAAQVYAEAGWVVAKADAHDFRVRFGARGTAIQWGSFRLTGQSALVFRSTENDIYKALGFGVSSGITLGVYRPGWFMATEGGFDKNVVARITNSDWYRTWFFRDAKDGWYGSTAGTLNVGVVSGVMLGRTELTARAGMLKTERFNDVTPPFYASLGVGYRVK